MIVIILITIALVAVVYILAIKPYTYWSKKNVKTGKITRIIGDNLYILLGMESFADLTKRMYNKVQDVRYLGVYQFSMPLFVAKSPDIIKKICVKDFDHFMDHRTVLPDGIDELWSRNLFSLRGQTWKIMRSTLTPSFTSSKIRAMFLLICENADLFARYFQEKNEEIVKAEFKDEFSRYTSDVIASAAFGVEIDSLRNRNNEFYSIGKRAANLTSITMKLKFIFYLLAPKLTAFLGIPILDREIEIFFLQLVEDTMKTRLEQNIKRPDMLTLLMQASEEEYSRKKLSTIEIASQVFVFFLGGFETVSTAMCFMAYELAVNPDIQRRLIEEMDENSDGFSYDRIATMPYLDMVVSETLRKWPIAIATDRVVTKPYTIQPELPHEQPVHLDIGDTLMIPIYAIHHDPKYYPDPEKFDPERFSSDNRKKIDPYSYLPFGIGPRQCIGSRFAILEIKAVFFHILTRFEIVTVRETRIPLRIKKNSYNLSSEDGFHLGLKRRFDN